MQLNHSLQLTYCTSVHRSESWPETFCALQTHTLAVREKVCPRRPFGIGLRLSERSAVELSDPPTLLEFRRWLGKNSSYVFTLNGFPYGQFHGVRVKENLYRPDWTSPERVAYTNLLFNLLAELLPPGMEGSVSTLPGSFKEFYPSAEAVKTMRHNTWSCVEHAARVSEKTGRLLHLALEPEPLCLLESTAETLHAFDHFRAEHPHDDRLARHLGINYDASHFAVEFEEPQNALACLLNAGIKISKIQLSSALKVLPTPATREALKPFASDPFLHPVVTRDAAGNRTIFRDLPDALAQAAAAGENEEAGLPEWRIHFHVPLHAPPAPPFMNTNEHVQAVLDMLAASPTLCSHLEMETHTWEVLPPELKSRSIVEQLAAEYDWTLAQLRERGLARPGD